MHVKHIGGYSMDIKNSFNLTDILIGILAVLAMIFFIGGIIWFK